MREILFKAKRIDNGEWIEGYYFKARHHWHKHGIHEDWIVVNAIQNGGWCNVYGKYAIDINTLCQYTGLTDKNGNKIWENDVVEVTYRDSRFAENYTEIGFIKYFSCSARYRYVFKEETWNFDCSNEIEVIGNIFDNPELLKGE